jgi:hypothetical protein
MLGVKGGMIILISMLDFCVSVGRGKLGSRLTIRRNQEESAFVNNRATRMSFM